MVILDLFLHMFSSIIASDSFHTYKYLYKYETSHNVFSFRKTPCGTSVLCVNNVKNVLNNVSFNNVLIFFNIFIYLSTN